MTKRLSMYGNMVQFYSLIVLVISYIQLAFLESNHISHCIIKTNLLVIDEL
jgi:hypothetical protein